MELKVIRRSLEWDLTAAEVLRLLRADAHPVALCGSWAGGSDIVASDPVRVCADPEPVGSVLDGLVPGIGHMPERAGDAGFGGGWIGYLGFGLSGVFLPVPLAPGEPRRLPAWWFGFYDHVLRRDRVTGRWFFEALDIPGRDEAVERRFAELSRRPHPAARGYSCGGFQMIPGAGEHRSAVRKAIDCVRRGDIFQANVCLRLEAGFTGDPLDAFCGAVSRLDPPYAAFLRLADGAVASLSPELFLRRTRAMVLSRPIKGTRARPADGKAASREREALEGSAKDRAENVMIVDLMRNDLSQVCRPGSVRVPSLLQAEAHPGVWHLVSEVQGMLAPGAGDRELIAAVFPPGSVTGAPKVRALEIIHELETTPREVYTGAIGYRSPLAGLELNVAIRTFEFCGDRVWLGSGGGITAKSDADSELQECLLKATPLIQALGGRLSRKASAPQRRPRPATGVFTSLRVTEGACRDLDAHLTRLDASTRELFGKSLPESVRARLAAALAGRPSGRLRVTVRPFGGPLRVTIEIVPEGPAAQTAVLRPVVVPGGLGAHKWRDRRLLAALGEQSRLAPGEHLLIQDSSGDVLETDRASVFAVIRGVLRTPPADGRLLPGVTRAAVLQLARGAGIHVAEEPMSIERLRRASEVFVTNSVHGVVPARFQSGSAGPEAAWAPGPVTTQLRAALARLPLASGCAPGPVARPPSRKAAAPPAGRTTRPVILLIDNYDSFTYNLAHLLLGSGCRVEVVRNDEVTAADIAGFRPAGIVISPGPGTPADAGVSVEAVLAGGPVMPVLGICLGHQTIAAAYGARIVIAPEPVHGQPARVTHDGHGVLAGLPQGFLAARYHSLVVGETTLPPALVITARGPGRIPMGLRHARHPVEGLQFHPESILTTCGDVIIGNFARTVRTRLVWRWEPPLPGSCIVAREHVIPPCHPCCLLRAATGISMSEREGLG